MSGRMKVPVHPWQCEPGRSSGVMGDESQCRNEVAVWEEQVLCSLLDSAAKVCVVTCRGPPNAHLGGDVSPKKF